MNGYYISGISPEATSFLQDFEHLFPPERLTFLGLLFDRVDNGMINSENKANSFEVSDDGYILTSDELGIEDCGNMAFELVHKANDCFDGSFPHRDLIDCIDTWITRTPSLDITESHFNKLSFLDKLYVLSELFCRIGGGDIGVELDRFNIDGYVAAHILLNLIAELFPCESIPDDLPF